MELQCLRDKAAAGLQAVDQNFIHFFGKKNKQYNFPFKNKIKSKEKNKKIKMSISHDDSYHKRIRARIREFNDIEASRNSPEMIMDSQTRRGHIVHGTNAYSEPMVEGGKKKKRPS